MQAVNALSRLLPGPDERSARIPTRQANHGAVSKAAIAAQVSLAFCSMLVMPPAVASPMKRAYLASIHGVKLRSDEFVTAFSIDTWGVTYRAVCHLPPGWFIKAGRTAAPDGRFEGQGTHGVTYLTPRRLSELSGMLLITLDSPVRSRARNTPRTTTPPTFDGKLTISSFSAGERQIRIGAENVRLVPANRCPADDVQRSNKQ